MTLGESIRAYRETNRLSLRQFADKCNGSPDGSVTNGYISMLEMGKNPNTGKPIIPSIDKLAAIAYGMGISLHQLITSCEDMPVYLKSGEVVNPELDELTALREDLRRRPEMRTLFSLTRKATPKQVRMVVKMLEAMRDGDEDE